MYDYRYDVIQGNIPGTAAEARAGMNTNLRKCQATLSNANDLHAGVVQVQLVPFFRRKQLQQYVDLHTDPHVHDMM